MRKVLVILGLFLILPFWSQAQIDCWQEERTVSTDWRDSIHPNPFDWTAQTTDFRYLFWADSLFGPTAPFYGRGFGYDSITQAFYNTAQPMGINQPFLNAFEEGGLSYIDYWPEDGWETFKGSNTWFEPNNSTTRFLMLYNRYRGLYRIMFFIRPRESHMEYLDDIWMQLRFIDDYQRTAMFGYANPVMEAIETYERSNNMVRPMKIQPTMQGFWIYADFPVVFDACPCLWNDAFRIQINLFYKKLEDENTGRAVFRTAESEKEIWPELDEDLANRMTFTSPNTARPSVFAPENNGIQQLDSWTEAAQDLKAHFKADAGKRFNGDVGLPLLEANLDQQGVEWPLLYQLIDSARVDNRVAASLGTHYNYFNGGGNSVQGDYTALPIVAKVGEGVWASPTYGNFGWYSSNPHYMPWYTDSFVSALGPDGYQNVPGVFNVLRRPRLEALPYKVEAQGPPFNSGDLKNSQFHEYRLAAPLDFMLNPNAKLKPLKIMAGIQYKVKESGSFSQGYSYWGSTANRHNKLAGPVLLGPKAEAEAYDLFTEHYFSYHSWDSVTSDPSEAVLQDVVSLYGGGQELAYWPSEAAMPNDKASDLTFRTPLFSIQDFHKYSFKVWGHPKDVDMVLKVYAFFVPENDPTRAPLLMLFTYHLDPDVRIRTQDERSFSFAYDRVGRRTNQIKEMETSLYEDVWLDDLLIAPREQLVLDGFNFGPIVSENGRVRITESGSIIASNIYLNQPLELDPGVQVTLYSYHTQLANNFSLPPGLQIIALDTDVEPHTANTAIQEAACTSPSYLNTERRLEEVEEGTAVLFPNPADAQSQLQFNLESRAEVSIEVFDVLGRQHWSGSWNLPEGPHRRFIQVGDWTNGIYFCRLSINGETQVFTLRVQH